MRAECSLPDRLTEARMAEVGERATSVYTEVKGVMVVSTTTEIGVR